MDKVAFFKDAVIPAVFLRFFLRFFLHDIAIMIIALIDVYRFRFI